MAACILPLQRPLRGYPRLSVSLWLVMVLLATFHGGEGQKVSRLSLSLFHGTIWRNWLVDCERDLQEMDRNGVNISALDLQVPVPSQIDHDLKIS